MRFLLLLTVLVLTGCTTVKPLKGGSARVASSGGNSGTNWYEFTQTENPEQSSSQVIERKTKVDAVIPAGSTVTLAGNTNQTFTISEPMPIKTETTEKVGTTLGAAQKDTARELGARFAAMRPVQWAGVLLILGAVALAYFGWWTPAGIAGAAGAGMIVLAQVLPGHEWFILAGGVVVAALGVLIVFYAYNAGRLDPYLPDTLDKNPPKPS